MPNGSRHFCVTDYGRVLDPALPDVRTLDGTRWEQFARDNCECFRGQLERGAKSGRLHYQIYFKVKGRKTFEQVKALLGFTDIKIQGAKSAGASWSYCSKAHTRVDGGWEYSLGEAPAGQGSRSDLGDLKRALDAGGLVGAFDSEFSSAVKFARGCQLYLSTKLGSYSRAGKTKVWVFTGAPGCGKSSLATKLAAHFGCELYVKPCSEKWFDHYDPLRHKAVLLDDFTGWIPYNQLLAISDRGQCYVEVKGGTMPFLAEHLFITSNVPWNKWYDWEKKSPDAFKRRIDFEWLGDFHQPIVNVGNGAVIDLTAGQSPKCPVILGGHLDFTPLYHGNGEWELDEIVIEEE